MPRHPVQPQDDQVETRTLVLYCYGAFELNMFLRLRSGLAARGWSVHVVTHLPSLVLRARRAGIGATLARPPKADTAPAIPLDQTPEGLLGQVTEAQARRFANSAWEAMHRAAASHPLRAVSLMNGLRLGGRITTAFAERHALPKLFVELGNVESKLFVDPEGVNAAARLSRHPEMIDAYDMSDEEIAEWRAGFIARRQAVVAIPQARAQINPWFAFDWIATRLLRIPQPLPLSIRERLVFKVRHVFRWHAPDVKPEGRYIFLPLQVSYDVNLLLISDYDNLAAIKYAAARASERGVSLVVKPHPAEQDARALAAIRKACE